MTPQSIDQSDPKKRKQVSETSSESVTNKRAKEQELTSTSTSIPPSVTGTASATSSSNSDVSVDPKGKILVVKKDNCVTPVTLLSNATCKVQTLTVSDQHATLLLTSTRDNNNHDPDNKDEDEDENEGKEMIRPTFQSLLKLTMVPFHKEILGSNPVHNPNDALKPEVNLLDHKPEASDQIKIFLKQYNYTVKSESGAEYSYYSAAPSSSKSNNTNAFGAFDVELISPATKRQISRAMPNLGSTLIHETPELYQTVVQPYIHSIVEGNSLSWIQNVIQVKKEKERLIVNSDQFIVNIDTKWRTHPPPLSTPRSEWYNHPSVKDLYCLGIAKDVCGRIASLRDLRQCHIPMLKSLQKEGLEAIRNIYGVASDQIRCFVHYQPQFYHFHVHFTRLENEVGSTVERGHLVADIVQNLELDPLYYEKRTITYKLKKMSPLHCLIAASLDSNGNGNDDGES